MLELESLLAINADKNAQVFFDRYDEKPDVAQYCGHRITVAAVALLAGLVYAVVNGVLTGSSSFEFDDVADCLRGLTPTAETSR